MSYLNRTFTITNFHFFFKSHYYKIIKTIKMGILQKGLITIKMPNNHILSCKVLVLTAFLFIKISKIEFSQYND